MNRATDFEPKRQAPLPFEQAAATRGNVSLGKSYEQYSIELGGTESLLCCCWESSSAFGYALQSSSDQGDVLEPDELFIFLFATPMVQHFERINVTFQHTKADQHELCQALVMHQRVLQIDFMR